MKVRNHIFLALLAVAFMASCSEADKTIEFGVDNNSIDIEAVGGTRKVNVSAGENWVATSSAPWITVLPANGRGSKECSLIIDSAITTSPRDGYVLFINTDNNNEYKRVDVSQKGFDYAITLDEPSVNIENYATLDKRYFDVKVKTNVAFNVKVVDEETGAEPSWVDVGQFNVNLDHGRRPREVSLRISWGINSTPMQRNALLSFTSAETDVTSEMLARNDELTINQNAAERIVTGRGGDSIALLGIARSLEVWDSNWESSGEKMDNWDGVVLWEEGMSGYVDSLKGRVKSAEFNSFSTKEGIPYEVQYLTAAEELKFYSNVNTFQLNLSTGPYICELTQLKRLTIGAYGLTELDENFTKLKNLEYLDLSSNNFEQVPAVINPENFPKLHALQMVNNQRLLIYDLSNSISTNFGGLYLHTKYDSAQDTFGEFPTWLLKWESDAAKGIAGLDTLKLSVNYLQGSIPDFKDDATIGYYDDEDFIRPDTIPAIHVKRVMPQLKMFALNLNRLTGELPEWILYHPALDSALSVVALFAFHACSTEDLVEPSASNTQSEPTEMSGEVIVNPRSAICSMNAAWLRPAATPLQPAAVSTPWTRCSTCSASASSNAYSRSTPSTKNRPVRPVSICGMSSASATSTASRRSSTASRHSARSRPPRPTAPSNGPIAPTESLSPSPRSCSMPPQPVPRVRTDTFTTTSSSNGSGT